MRPSNVNGIDLDVPSTFAGILPVGSGSFRFAFEPYAYFGLAAVLKPGDVAFDVGASYGVLTVLMAHLVGEEGRVYSFEANRAPLDKARELVAANHMADRVLFVNACVGECSDTDVEFFAAPGFASVASSRNPQLRERLAGVERVLVAGLALDEYCERMVVKPGCMKLDVEGSEYVALQGSRRLVERHQPDLIIETHGSAALGIGGSLGQLCAELEERGYGFFDLRKGVCLSATEYVERYANKIGYVLASSRLGHAEFVDMLVERHGTETAIIERFRTLDQELGLARKYVNSGRSTEALSILRDFLKQVPDHAEANYLVGCCIQSTETDKQAALEHYRLALEYGFDEFWICHNRHVLSFDIGDYESARRDLARARELNPGYEGIAAVRNRLEG